MLAMTDSTKVESEAEQMQHLDGLSYGIRWDLDKMVFTRWFVLREFEQIYHSQYGNRPLFGKCLGTQSSIQKSYETFQSGHHFVEKIRFRWNADRNERQSKKLEVFEPRRIIRFSSRMRDDRSDGHQRTCLTIHHTLHLVTDSQSAMQFVVMMPLTAPTYGR
jgi:hypothetical protein